MSTNFQELLTLENARKYAPHMAGAAAGSLVVYGVGRAMYAVTSGLLHLDMETVFKVCPPFPPAAWWQFAA
jgi:hypothetical protein